MRFAVIEGENVTNVILIEVGEIEPMKAALAPAEVLACPDEVGPGWTYVDRQFMAPPEPEEPEVESHGI